MKMLYKSTQMSLLALALFVGAGVISAVDNVPNGFQNYLMYMATFLFIGGAILSFVALLEKIKED